MADTLKLQIVTPQAIVVSEDVHMVTLPAIEGELGIYPHHTRVITQIVPGEIMVTKLFVNFHPGLFVTDMAIPSDQIDEAKVEEARQRAAARLEEKLSDEEVATVNASLARSLAQLQVKRRRPM